ncbi:hypothetical protein A8B78_09525 [Jannaschia sp. EhC01]|nr:hypothetical protein A8B78_09525 [Jannaschia sp. EhC01]
MCCQAAGGSSRQVRCEIHLGIHEKALIIQAVEIAGKHIGHATVLPNLLSQIPPEEQIDSVAALFQ